MAVRAGAAFARKRASEFQRSQESSGKLVDGGPGGISINARLAIAWKALIKMILQKHSWGWPPRPLEKNYYIKNKKHYT